MQVAARNARYLNNALRFRRVSCSVSRKLSCGVRNFIERLPPDLGRAFSVLVLLSGIVLLLIVLPFAFIRFFYAPWLEAQLRLRAPREAAKDAKDHVIQEC